IAMKKIFQVLGIVLCIFPMIGFGWCGLMGLGESIGSKQNNGMLIVLGLMGIVISAAFGYAIYVMFKGLSSGFSDDQPPAP
ncbi:MAG: hypothetical protein ACXU7H_03160, partial [Burkholderiaceae bacterium]